MHDSTVSRTLNLLNPMKKLAERWNTVFQQLDTRLWQ